MDGQRIGTDEMTSAETTIKIFEKLETLAGHVGDIRGDVKVIKNELKNKADVVEVISRIDEKIKDAVMLHADNCRGLDLAKSKRFKSDSPPSKDTGSIRISLKGMSPFVKGLIYTVATAVSAAIGYLAALKG